MHVDYQKIDDLNARMTVTISREDYERKYRDSLRDYRKKASLKGFRKGKTPVGYLEKLFGQEALTRTVTDLLTNAVNTYLEDHEVPFIGQPLPAKDQKPLGFDPKDLQETYRYTFDIGLLPEFEVKGMDQEIEWYDVPVADDEVETQWQELRRRHGTYAEAGEIDEESRVQMHFREVEGDNRKEGGKEHTRMIFLQMLSEQVRGQLTGKGVGQVIRFKPDEFLEQGDVQAFRQYYMDVKDETELSEIIEGEVVGISNLEPAEPNETLFNTAFEQGTVTTEEQAKEVIASALKQRNDARSDTHLRHMIEHRLIDENQIDLPYDFLDRLTGDGKSDAGSPLDEPDTAGEADHTGQDASTPPETEKSNEGSDATDDSSAKKADQYRWHFIREKLYRKFSIEVSEDEILRAAADHVYDRFGGYLPYDRMREIISRYLSDKDSVSQIRNSVADTKLFHAMKEHMPVVKKEISSEEFDKIQEAHTHDH